VRKLASPDLAPFMALAAAFAALVTVLGFRVSLRRVKVGGVVFGDGGDDVLKRRIRAHGNFAEYAPLQLLIVLALVLAGIAPGAVWGLAGAFLAIRLVHAWAIGADSRTPIRAVAMAVQHLATLAAAGLIVWNLLG
jgi:uncharacterized membrane protein YecN with MAPEG domain